MNIIREMIEPVLAVQQLPRSSSADVFYTLKFCAADILRKLLPWAVSMFVGINIHETIKNETRCTVGLHYNARFMYLYFFHLSPSIFAFVSKKLVVEKALGLPWRRDRSLVFFIHLQSLHRTFACYLGSVLHQRGAYSLLIFDLKNSLCTPALFSLLPYF
jgi:hypothetical protein